MCVCILQIAIWDPPKKAGLSRDSSNKTNAKLWIDRRKSRIRDTRLATIILNVYRFLGGLNEGSLGGRDTYDLLFCFRITNRSKCECYLRQGMDCVWHTHNRF